MGYQYWLIRYVPDTIRGEFVNVGVLVGEDGGDWAIRRVRSFRRANRLGGDAAQAEAWLSEFEQRIADHHLPPLYSLDGRENESVSSGWVRSRQDRLNNSIQISSPRPVEASSASEGVELLFALLVTESTVSPRSYSRQRLVSDLRGHYLGDADSRVRQSLRTRPRAVVGRQQGTFDFAVAESRVNQLTQVWSFDIKDLDRLDQEVRSWNYLVSLIREEGGEVPSDNLLLESLAIEPSVPVRVVYQVPSGNRARDHFYAAKEGWDRLDILSYPSDQMDAVSNEASLLLQSA